jgi:hypothetical protein
MRFPVFDGGDGASMRSLTSGRSWPLTTPTASSPPRSCTRSMRGSIDSRLGRVPSSSRSITMAMRTGGKTSGCSGFGDGRHALASTEAATAAATA